MFATKQTTIVPDIHGKQSSTPVNFGGIPNLELESGTTGAPGHIVQQDGGKFDLQFGRASLPTSTVGHVIQVVEMHSETRTTVYNTSSKIYDVQIVTKNDNSKIYVALNTCRGTSKKDAHCAMAMGYKTGATSTSSSDYTSLHSTTAYEIEPIPNLGAFWGQETQDPNSHNSELGRYGMVPVLFNKLHEPNVPAGTTLSYSLWGAADSSRFLAIGGPSNSGTSLAAGGLGTTGYDSSITLMEISSV